jgi:hypothetical protein
MASGLYKTFKQQCLESTGPDLSSETIIKAFLIDTADYTVDLSVHNFLDDVAGAARVAGPVTLTSTTTTSPEGGVFDAADISFTSVTGDSVEALLIYYDSGSEATSLLIAWVEFSAVTPNGGNINVTFDSGANRIFKL